MKNRFNLILFLMIIVSIWLLSSCSLKRGPDIASGVGAQDTLESGDTWGITRSSINANFSELYSTKLDISQIGTPYDTEAELSALFSGKQAADTDLDIFAGITPSANVQTILNAAAYANIREYLDLEPGVDFYSMSAADAAFQALNATLTDISDNTIATNLVNTDYPWADNEVANDITLTDITQITNRAITSLTGTNWRLLYINGSATPVELALGASGTFLKSNGPSAAPSFDTPSGTGDMLKSVYDANDDGYIDPTAIAEPSPTPGFVFQDNDCADSDNNYQFSINATDTGSGTEDIDVSESVQRAGAPVVVRYVDADGNYRIGRVDMTVQVVGDLQVDGDLHATVPVEIGVAFSDETTDLTTGTGKVTFRAPYAFTLTEVRTSVNTAPVGAGIQVDVNEGGDTVFSTPVTIDASETTSTTAATPYVISDSDIADDAEMTIDVDQVGSTTAGKGGKIWLIGTRSL